MPDNPQPSRRGGARPNTGGRRANAGRKATGTTPVTVRVPPVLMAYIDSKAAQLGVSRQKFIMVFIDWVSQHDTG